MTQEPTAKSPYASALLPDESLDTVNEGLHLIRKKNGLTFGTDAYLLAAYVRPQRLSHAVELGGGTGIISLLLLTKEKVGRITAVEVQEPFAELMGRNAAINGLSDRFTSLCRDLRDLRPCDIGGEVPLVFSNPPYMTCTSGKRNVHDEKYIARHEVHGTIQDFCDCAARLLKHGGHFVCVWRPDRFTDLLNAMHTAHLEPKRMTFVHADGEHEACAVLVDAVKGASPSLKLTAPLLLYKAVSEKSSKRILTDEAQKIYDTCAFPD